MLASARADNALEHKGRGLGVANHQGHLIFLALILVAFALARLSGYFGALEGKAVILGALLGTVGLVGVVVWNWRRVARERPKPPWPTDSSAAPEDASTLPSGPTDPS